MILHADIESFSACDIKSCGGHRYAHDKSTELLCIGLALNDSEPVIWIDPRWHDHLPWYTGAEFTRASELVELMTDHTVLVYAHNATGFEVPMLDALLKKQTGHTPPRHSQYRCTAAMARRAALPPSLEKCAEALKLSQKKDTRGKALIRKFCIPQEFEFKPTKPEKKEFEKRGITLAQAEAEARAAFKPRILPSDEPDAFKELCDYCKQDVRAEREIHRALKHFELMGFALESFQVDLALNTTGFPVNLSALRKAKALLEETVPLIEQEFREHTGLNPTQTEKFTAWLKERGYEGDNLRAETMENIIEAEGFDERSDVGKALLLRQRISFAAVNKVDAMLITAGPHDNHVRGTLTWHGAGPGRWTASLVQPHNMKKPSAKLVSGVDAKASGFEDSDDMLEWLTASAYQDICNGCSVGHIEMMYGSFLEVLSSCIRHFIQDHRGPMCNADYSAIEARVLSWLAGEEWRMEVFRTHGRIYEASACQMFGLTMDQITKPIRQKGKVSELALGYMGSVGALITMGALKMGLKEEELMPLVKLWRKANSKIVDFWYALNDAACEAIYSRGKERFKAGRVTFYMAQTAGLPYLFMVLPSQRKIAYPYPKIEPTLMWTDKEGNKRRIVNPSPQQIVDARKEDPEKCWLKDGITYWGEIKSPTGGKSTQWGRVSLSPGVMAENATMGTATDIMSIGLVNAHRAGYRLYTMIHDEALAAYEPQKGQSIEEFCELLTTLPAWADGLPVKADGGIVPFYRK